MKTRLVFKIVAVVAVLIFVGQSYSCNEGETSKEDTQDTTLKKNNVAPIGCAKCEEYKKLFNDRKATNSGGFSYSPYFAIPVGDLRDSTASKFMLAILSLKKDSVVVDFLPSNASGDRESDDTHDRYAEIMVNQDALKTKLKDGLPLALTKFPLIIKMETSNLLRLKDETGARLIAFFPAIETKTNRLTLCAAGSDDGRTLHRAHDKVLCEETWPDENVTYYER